MPQESAYLASLRKLERLARDEEEAVGRGEMEAARIALERKGRLMRSMSGMGGPSGSAEARLALELLESIAESQRSSMEKVETSMLSLRSDMDELARGRSAVRGYAGGAGGGSASLVDDLT